MIEEDLHPVRMLLYLHLFADESIGYRVPIGVQIDVSFHVNDPMGCIIDRRYIDRQRFQIWFFNEVRFSRAHPQRAFHLLVGLLVAPCEGLVIEVMPVGKRPTSEKVSLDVGKGPLDSRFSIGMTDPVGNKRDAIDTAERFHFGGHLGIRTGSAGNDHAGVVNDHTITDSVHESKRICKEDFGLKPGEARIVPDEKPSAVGQDEPSALGCRGFPGQDDLVGRSVMLHLLSGTEGVHSHPFLLRFPESLLSGNPGQGAVSD